MNQQIRAEWCYPMADPMTPTREDMARCCEDILVGAVVEDVNEQLSATIAELRKTCATCKWWVGVNEVLEPPGCSRHLGPFEMPTDGSGFCHRHEAKP